MPDPLTCVTPLSPPCEISCTLRLSPLTLVTAALLQPLVRGGGGEGRATMPDSALQTRMHVPLVTSQKRACVAHMVSLGTGGSGDRKERVKEGCYNRRVIGSTDDHFIGPLPHARHTILMPCKIKDTASSLPVPPAQLIKRVSGSTTYIGTRCNSSLLD